MANESYMKRKMDDRSEEFDWNEFNNIFQSEPVQRAISSKQKELGRKFKGKDVSAYLEKYRDEMYRKGKRVTTQDFIDKVNRYQVYGGPSLIDRLKDFIGGNDWLNAIRSTRGNAYWND